MLFEYDKKSVFDSFFFEVFLIERSLKAYLGESPIKCFYTTSDFLIHKGFFRFFKVFF